MTEAPKPVRKRRPKRRVATMPEKEIQGLAEELCMALHIRFFRIPDYILGYLARTAPPAIRQFVSGYLAGLPDLLLFKPLPDGRNEVLFLEIKTEAGKLSPSQERWHSGLNVKVAYGWDEVEEIIKGFK